MNDVDVYFESEHVYGETAQDFRDEMDLRDLVMDGLTGSEDWDDATWDDFREWLDEIGYTGD